MILIRATESFRKAAEQLTINVGEMDEPTPGLWRLPRRVPSIPEAHALVSRYNTDEDKFPAIQAESTSSLRIERGPTIVWLCGPLAPSKSHTMSAIVIPPPQSREETCESRLRGSDIPTSDALAQAPTPTRTIGESLQAQPKVKIYGLDATSGRPLDLRVGDTVQIEAHEKMIVEQGGIALILMSYKHM